MVDRSFFVVGIGASAGGLPALIEFFKRIPFHSNAAFIVATHLLRDRRSFLDEILSRYAALPLIRVENDMLLEPGKIYLIVENTTLIVAGKYLKVRKRDALKINSSVNILFDSLACEFSNKAIGIILSGGGNDGLNGVGKIEEMGGLVLVQDPASAQVTGMPYAVVKGDHPAAILEPAEIASLVNKLCDRQ